MLANRSINEPADVTTSLERLDAIFTADITNAALTLSYSKVGIIGYLSVLKADASVAHYADSNEGYKCNGARYYSPSTPISYYLPKPIYRMD